MGDGNIEWNPEKEKLTLAELHLLDKHQDYYDTPRSLPSIDGTECITPTSPASVLLEELHRNTNNSVNTPDLSNASITNPTVERPPAGESQISPRRNGRRNFRQDCTSADNAFGLPLGPAAGLGRQESGHSAADGIFSVRGTRSVKINRHRDNVSVFPSGCMGVTDIEEDAHAVPVESEVGVKEAESVVPTLSHHSEEQRSAVQILQDSMSSTSKQSEVVKTVVQTPTKQSQVQIPVVQTPVVQTPVVQSSVEQPPAVQSPVVQSPAVQSPAVQSPRSQSPARGAGAARSAKLPIPDMKPVVYTSTRGSFRPNSAVRNPLTGEGYTDKDIRRHFTVKKPDGNPLLGQGYDDAKSSRQKHVPPGGFSNGLW